METSTQSAERASLLRHALQLEYLTVGWNVVEGIVAVVAAFAAGSVALLGFGLDSFIECLSGAVLIWRLLAEHRAEDRAAAERIEQRALRAVGLSLFVLAAWVVFDATRALWTREEPSPSLVGILLTSISIGVMWWLARAKRRAAVALGSRALAADSFQTTACWWLSLTVLGGMGLNALLGWWWADPIAALGMTFFLIREGREAWRGDACCS